MKKSSHDRTKNLIIIGDSKLNNVNSRGLSKSKKVEASDFPGATNTNIFNKMDNILGDKSQSLIAQVYIRELTNNVNLLNNVKKKFNKTKKKLPRNYLQYLFLILSFKKTANIWKNFALIQTQGLKKFVT